MVSIDQEALQKELTRILNGIAIEFQEALKDMLTWEHGKFTSALQSSVKATVINNTIVITMEDYWDNLEYGTPHFVEPEDLVEWLIQKRKLTRKQAEKRSVAMAEHITKHGTRPYPFIRTTIQNKLNDIIKRNFSV